METIRYTFKKEERLCGELRIASLFREGKTEIAYPLRVCWLYREEQAVSPIQVMIGAPKKKLHRANRRNRVKRLMREVYRLQKHELSEAVQQKGGSLQMAFVWLSEDSSDYATVYAKMGKLLNKVLTQIKP